MLKYLFFSNFNILVGILFGPEDLLSLIGVIKKFGPEDLLSLIVNIGVIKKG